MINLLLLWVQSINAPSSVRGYWRNCLHSPMVITLVMLHVHMYMCMYACTCAAFGHSFEEEEEDQSLGQSWVWSVSDFIFLALAYEGRWPVLSLTISSSHWQCAVSVLIIAELTRGRRWSRNLEPNFCPGRDLNPEPHGWRSSTLTTGPPRNPGHSFDYCIN